jgi:transcriptional regulator with XRE-family HTH domain
VKNFTGDEKFYEAVKTSETQSDLRFAYVPKASRREREAGLEGMPTQKAGVGHRAVDQGEYLDFVHPAPDGIGAWLREHRERAGLSAKALCGIVGAHGAVNHGGAVTNWEQGYNRPTPDQWWKLKAALGFDDRHDDVMTETRPVEKSVFDDRERATARNVHPTVKPLALMRWLCRLVTPPGG